MPEVVLDSVVNSTQGAHCLCNPFERGLAASILQHSHFPLSSPPFPCKGIFIIKKSEQTLKGLLLLVQIAHNFGQLAMFEGSSTFTPFSGFKRGSSPWNEVAFLLVPRLFSNTCRDIKPVLFASNRAIDILQVKCTGLILVTNYMLVQEVPRWDFCHTLSQSGFGFTSLNQNKKLDV